MGSMIFASSGTSGLTTFHQTLIHIRSFLNNVQMWRPSLSTIFKYSFGPFYLKRTLFL